MLIQLLRIRSFDILWLYSFRVIDRALLLEIRLLVIWRNGSLCHILRLHATDACDQGECLKSSIIHEFVLALSSCSL